MGTLVASGYNVADLPPGAVSGPVAVAPATPVSAITTNQGVQSLEKTVAQATRLTTPPPTTPTETDSLKTYKPASYGQQPGNIVAETPAMQKDRLSGDNKITLINPNTEQTVSFSGKDIDQNNVKSYTDAGYQLSEATGQVPSWLTPTGVSSNPQLEASKSKLKQAETDLATQVSKLQNFNVSNDPELQAVLSGVTSQWDQRISELRNAEDSRIAALNTTGLRMGSQYTGGMGGVMGGIISAEERKAVNDIANLESQKAAALAQAKQAYTSGKWSQYKDLISIAQDSYNKQLSAVTELQKAQATQDQKIKDAQTASVRSSDIATLYAAGTTDPTTILKSLRDSGDTTATLDDVSKAIKDLTPVVAKTDTFKFSQPQQSHLLAAGLNKDQMQALHDYYNGTGTPDALSELTPEQQAAVHDALNGTAAKKAASGVPTYAQLHPKAKAPGKSVLKSGSLTYTAQDINDGHDALTKSKNYGPLADGQYANPDTYLAMAKAWRDQGGAVKDFIKNYPISSWINPANTYVVPKINALVRQDASAVKTTDSKTDLAGKIDAAFGK